MGLFGSRFKSAAVPDAGLEGDDYDKNHPTLEFVKKKVRKYDPKLNEDAAMELAELLINPEAIKTKYFAHIVKKINSIMLNANKEANNLGRSGNFRNQGDMDAAREELAYNREHVLKVDVKLLWEELDQNAAVQFTARIVCPLLKKNKFVYGPFHVALLVDDVVIEWTDTSLVVPYRKRSPQPILAANIGEPPELCTPLEASLRNPAQFQSFITTAKEIAIHAENKLHLIDQLCGMIAHYNKKYLYAIFTNNCQHFAKDVLTCLGMNEDAEIFHGKSKVLAETVMAGFAHSRIFKTATATSELNSHEELNRYVTEEGEGMSRDDLEFCQLHYLLFHAWSKKFPENDAWRCNEEECKLGLVEDRLRDIRV